MTYRNIPLRLFFTKVMRGRRSVILGIGPLWITWAGNVPTFSHLTLEELVEIQSKLREAMVPR